MLLYIQSNLLIVPRLLHQKRKSNEVEKVTKKSVKSEHSIGMSVLILCKQSVLYGFLMTPLGVAFEFLSRYGKATSMDILYRRSQEIFTEHLVCEPLIDYIAIVEDTSMVPAGIELLPAEPAKSIATCTVGTFTAATRSYAHVSSVTEALSACLTWRVRRLTRGHN